MLLEEHLAQTVSAQSLVHDGVPSPRPAAGFPRRLDEGLLQSAAARQRGDLQRPDHGGGRPRSEGAAQRDHPGLSEEVPPTKM